MYLQEFCYVGSFGRCTFIIFFYLLQQYSRSLCWKFSLYWNVFCIPLLRCRSLYGRKIYSSLRVSSFLYNTHTYTQTTGIFFFLFQDSSCKIIHFRRDMRLNWNLYYKREKVEWITGVVMVVGVCVYCMCHVFLQ